MVAAWGGICATEPPCIAISLRRSRLTYDNIMVCQAFTINIPSKQHLVQTDYLGMVSGKDTEKFSAAGLTPVRSSLVNAPYVKEFPLVLECKLLHAIELGLHTQFIGQIVDTKAEEDVLGNNGLPDTDKVNPLISSAAGRAYYALGGYLGQAYSVGSALHK
jgi:Conserved protein/domain typically associated with flavoprotein oxygenases, DIM6/NTAB family